MVYIHYNNKILSSSSLNPKNRYDDLGDFETWGWKGHFNSQYHKKIFMLQILRTLGMARGMRLGPCLLTPAVGNRSSVLLSLVARSSCVLSVSKRLLASRSSWSSCALHSACRVSSLGCPQLLSCASVRRRHHRRRSQSLFASRSNPRRALLFVVEHLC